MTLTIILIVLFTHYVSDFIYQTETQFKHKTRIYKLLFKHTLLYSTIFGSVFEIMVRLDLFGAQEPYIALYFTLITFITHTVVDEFTGKITHKLWRDGYDYKRLLMFGFDQIIHIAILFITIHFLCY